MATIKDIAKQLQIGVSTVSMALNDHPSINDKTKQKVLKAAKELGYVKNGIAVDLQKKKTNLILLIVDDASRPFFSRVIDATQREVAKYKYDLLIATTFHGNTQTAKRYISEHRADGAIIFTNRVTDDFIIQYATATFPIFVLGRDVETDNPHVLFFPSAKYEQISPTEYLIQKGHQKIAFVKGAETLGTINRFESYTRTLKQHNMSLQEDIIFDAKHSTIESGYQVTKEIIKKIQEIDAVIYANDDTAIGGLHAFKEADIPIPDTVSIIGHNNLLYSELISPKLTTTTISEYYISSYAVKLLIEKITNGVVSTAKINKYCQKLMKEKHIIERETVKDRR